MSVSLLLPEPESKTAAALGPDCNGMLMTPEEFESRLNRAIEMELTFQAAAAQGVDLTPEQARQVNRIAQRHEAALGDYQKRGITWSSVTPAQGARLRPSSRGFAVARRLQGAPGASVCSRGRNCDSQFLDVTMYESYSGPRGESALRPITGL